MSMMGTQVKLYFSQCRITEPSNSNKGSSIDYDEGRQEDARVMVDDRKMERCVAASIPQVRQRVAVQYACDHIASPVLSCPV